jgi:hypothetical protein
MSSSSKSTTITTAPRKKPQLPLPSIPRPKKDVDDSGHGIGQLIRKQKKEIDLLSKALRIYCADILELCIGRNGLVSEKCDTTNLTSAIELFRSGGKMTPCAAQKISSVLNHQIEKAGKSVHDSNGHGDRIADRQTSSSMTDTGARNSTNMGHTKEENRKFMEDYHVIVTTLCKVAETIADMELRVTEVEDTLLEMVSKTFQNMEEGKVRHSIFMSESRNSHHAGDDGGKGGAPQINRDSNWSTHIGNIPLEISNQELTDRTMFKSTDLRTNYLTGAFSSSESGIDDGRNKNTTTTTTTTTITKDRLEASTISTARSILIEFALSPGERELLDHYHMTKNGTRDDPSLLIIDNDVDVDVESTEESNRIKGRFSECPRCHNPIVLKLEQRGSSNSQGGLKFVVSDRGLLDEEDKRKLSSLSNWQNMPKNIVADNCIDQLQRIDSFPRPSLEIIRTLPYGGTKSGISRTGTSSSSSSRKGLQRGGIPRPPENGPVFDSGCDDDDDVNMEYCEKQHSDTPAAMVGGRGGGKERISKNHISESLWVPSRSQYGSDKAAVFFPQTYTI